MGKLKDMFGGQIKEYSKHRKKKKWEKTEPKFINFDITLKQIKENGLLRYDLMVTNLLDIKDRRSISTKAVETNEKGLITKILCPFCGKELKLNRHWHAYFCTNKEKKILEITDIRYDKPKEIKEIKEDEMYSLQL